MVRDSSHRVTLQGGPDRKAVLRQVKTMKRQPDLFQMIAAVGASGGLAGGLDRRQQQRRQDADDRDDHQQFDERKARRPRVSWAKSHGGRHVIDRFPRPADAQAAALAARGNGRWSALLNNRLLHGHCPSQRAAGHALVGLLAPELGLTRPSRRRVAAMAKQKGANLISLGYSGGAAPDSAPEIACSSALHGSSRPPRRTS